MRFLESEWSNFQFPFYLSAYQKGYNAFNEQLLSGIAPFYLTPQCVPSRGTLSIRLLKDNSSLPLPECILPVAIHESPFARRYDPSNIGILPIERRTGKC